MSQLTETIINLYEYTPEDIAQLEAALFEQLRLSWLEQMRALAIQHGVSNPTPVLRSPELEALQAKAREDALGIAETYDNDLRRQVEAIANREPNATRADYIDVLSSWGRARSGYKATQIAIATIMWCAYYGIQQFISRNNLQAQLFRAVGATPVCEDCRWIVAQGIVNYNFTKEFPLPFHPNCTHEYVFVNATDLSANGNLIWLGDYVQIRAA